MRLALVMLVACGGKPAPATVTNTAPDPIPTASPPPVPDTREQPHGPAAPRALAVIDEANPRSIDAAIKEADALGAARDASAIVDLLNAAQRPPTKKLIAVQVAAVRALGKMTTARPQAANALGIVIDRPLPPRPRDGEEEQLYALHLARLGAAINALAELEHPLVEPLLRTLYTAPELTMQTRRALATMPAAAEELRKVLRGEHAMVNKLFKERALDKYCAKDGKCEPLATRDFYAAIALGDQRDATAVPDLLAAAAKPPLPVYFVDDTASPNTQHNAIFDALRKLAAPEAAAKLRAMWMSKKTAVMTRTLAIGAYAFCARDLAGADELWKIAADNTADDGLRTEAAVAFARLSNDKKKIDLFVQLAKKYTDAAAKKRAAADKLSNSKLAADNELADAKDALEAAKAKLIATTKDQATTAEQIRAATEVTKRAEAAYKDAKKAHHAKIGEWTMNDSAAKAYVGYARMFQTHVARVELAARCAEDTTCYAAALTVTPADAVQRVKPFLADVDTWTADEKQGLVDAYADRALLELTKRKATDKLDAVLAAAQSENRLIREAALIALPRLAPAPCPACVTKLDAAIEAGKGKTLLAALQIETQIVRNYFKAR